MSPVSFFCRTLALSTALICITATAQVSLSSLTYSENFNSFAGTALSMPAGWTASFSGTPTYGGTNGGTTATGGVWAFGTTGEYSLGALRSGTPGNITFDVSFTNNTGSTITSITFTWDYEQYRYQNTSGFTLAGTGALSLASLSSYSLSGSATGTSGTATVTPVSVTLSSLSISNGSSFGLRWVTTDLSGTDNNLAIDNFSMTATSAVPEPSTYAALAGACALGGVMWHRRRQRVLALKN